MPIARTGRFFETDDLGIVKSLGMESAHLPACIDEIKRRGIQGVFGCPAFGFGEDNLDFLAELSGIRQVWFWEVSLRRIDALYRQEDLEYFGIHPKRPPIDFSRLQRLRDAVWEPVAGDSGIDRLTRLRRLDIWRYKSGSKNFAELSLPASLRKLEFNWCNQESVAALQALPKLEELQFHYCRNLRSLDGLAKSMPGLKKLVVTRCANLEGIDEVLQMPLEHLYINIRGRTVADKSPQPGPQSRPAGLAP